jgi:dTDP-4-dehydrorhamnose 3,5-epimerase
MMDVAPTSFPGLFVLKHQRFEDPRGFFFESYNKRRFDSAVGLDVNFVQDNFSFSEPRLTIRGLHFQKQPWAQAKLVTVVKGAIKDAVVDLRRSSPCFGHHFLITLSAAAGNQLFIPIGFAHGFLTLEPDTLLAYKMSNYYSPDHDTGIRIDDAALGIDWGFDHNLMVSSDKDRQLPTFDPAGQYFP